MDSSLCYADSLAEMRESAQSELYRPPSREELHRAEVLFRKTLEAKTEIAALRHDWRTLNFDVIRVTTETDELLVLKEDKKHKTGRGFYVFRADKAQPIVVQAPHTFHDLYTGDIATRLFTENRAKSVAWNTVHRSDADLAHLPTSYFQAFTRAFAHVYSEGIVLQLHGFSQEKRVSRIGAKANLILSGGTQYPTDQLLRAATCLEALVGSQVHVYSHNVFELGGVTNSQGRTLRRMGHPGFVHIEMSVGFRKRLLEPDNVALRQALIQCFSVFWEAED